MQIRIEWIYKPLKSKQVHEMKSDFMSVEGSLELLLDLEKTGRVQGEVFFYDENDSLWTKKELQRYLKKYETEPQDVYTFIDGGFDRASKKAGIGIVIYYKQHQKKWRVRCNDQLDLLQDNNEAEYAALYRLIQQLEQMGVHHQRVTIHLDSIVVCNQASGEWPCYEEQYINWLDRIDELSSKLRLELYYNKIDRSANKEADQLASQALKGTIIESNKELYSKGPNLTF